MTAVALKQSETLAQKSASGRRRYARRSAERTEEILGAAAAEFLERGFDQAKLEVVAGRAGIARSLIYRYFATKEELFRAVVIQTLLPHVQSLRSLTESSPGGVAALLRGLARPMANVATSTSLPGVFKLVLSEAQAFPELARICHDQLLEPTLASLADVIAQAQARGEVRAGDPHLYGFQILAPLLATLTWRGTFVPVGGAAHDVEALLLQGVETFLEGALARA